MNSPAKVFLVLTVIGDDRPGLVGELAALISAHQGNWLESSMSRLAGQFAGIVKVELAAADAAALTQALARLPGLSVSTALSTAVAAHDGLSMRLRLVGHDRLGIVREISQALARHAVNVDKLTTYTSSAAMSAETLFHAEAVLHLPAGLAPQQLTAALEALSDELMVELDMTAA